MCYTAELQHARLDALRALVDILRTTESEAERRRAAIAILKAPDADKQPDKQPDRKEGLRSVDAHTPRDNEPRSSASGPDEPRANNPCQAPDADTANDLYAPARKAAHEPSECAANSQSPRPTSTFPLPTFPPTPAAHLRAIAGATTPRAPP